MSVTARQLLVSGRVQGVGYRAWCRATAIELGLVGFVRNLDDGRVEVVAQGDATALDRLTQACRLGPRHARVDDVAVTLVLPHPSGTLTTFVQAVDGRSKG